jgi:hypothetical protein
MGSIAAIQCDSDHLCVAAYNHHVSMHTSHYAASALYKLFNTLLCVHTVLCVYAVLPRVHTG